MTSKPTSRAAVKHTATYAVTSRKCCQLLCLDVLGWSATFSAGPTAKRYRKKTTNSAAEEAAGKPNERKKGNIAGSPVTGEPRDTEISTLASCHQRSGQEKPALQQVLEFLTTKREGSWPGGSM